MSDKMDTGGPLALIGSAFLGAFVQWAFKRLQAMRRPRPINGRESVILLQRMDKYDLAQADIMMEIGALRGSVQGLAEKVARLAAAFGD